MIQPSDAPRPSAALRSVAEFHSTFGLPVRATPSTEVDPDVARLRVDLLEEEVAEFADATKRQDLTALADGLGDIVYVAYGTALTYGIDLDAVLAEIHRSNMSKLGADGRPVYREDGKVLKSALYSPPDIPKVLDAQAPLPLAD